MALGLASSGGGDIKPYIAFNAKAGRMYRIDRTQGADGKFVSEEHEITDKAQFAADLANIRVGWISFGAQGPTRRMVVLGKEAIPARPDDKDAEGKFAFKQAFEIDLVLNKESGGGPARIFGSSAAAVIDAMDELHDAYTAAPESKSGKLPVVKIASVLPVKSPYGTNYKPQFAIVAWVARPAALTEAAPSVAPAAAPPATGSKVVAPPVAVPQPAAASASDFG
jgi:hypothetical protein